LVRLQPARHLEAVHPRHRWIQPLFPGQGGPPGDTVDIGRGVGSESRELLRPTLFDPESLRISGSALVLPGSLRRTDDAAVSGFPGSRKPHQAGYGHHLEGRGMEIQIIWEKIAVLESFILGLSRLKQPMPMECS
jgi:hypothetical protein